MLKSLLETAEIESFSKNTILNTFAFDPTVTDNVKVMILGSDYEKAKKIVDDYLKNMKPG
jgi:hypothetical protein